MSKTKAGRWPGAKATASGIPVYCAHTQIAKLSELRPRPDNPNRHPREQIRLLGKIIAGEKGKPGNGWRNSIVVSDRSGMIVKGHGRYEAAKLMGLEEVPIDVQAYDTQEQEDRDLIADNRIAELAEMDENLLNKLLQDLVKKGEDLELAGFDLDEVARLLETTSQAIEEALATPRVKIEWGKFKVFHCVVGEQIYCLDRCNYLISFGTMGGEPPKRKRCDNTTVFIDSGMLTLARKVGAKAIGMQAQALKYAEDIGGDWVTMMDIPQVPVILKDLGMTRDQAFKAHMKNAREFAGFDTKLRKVYVAQGQTVDQYRQCCEAMKPLIKPSDVVAIGSIKDRSDNPELVAAITSTVHKVLPKNDKHLFGIASPPTVRLAIKYGATSADSSVAGIATKLGEFIFAKRVESSDLFKIESSPLGNLMGIPELSINSKLWIALTAFSMAQVEAALALSMIMEEAAINMTIGNHSMTKTKPPTPSKEQND
jgi:hypothetical protein